MIHVRQIKKTTYSTFCRAIEFRAVHPHSRIGVGYGSVTILAEFKRVNQYCAVDVKGKKVIGLKMDFWWENYSNLVLKIKLKQQFLSIRSHCFPFVPLSFSTYYHSSFEKTFCETNWNHRIRFRPWPRAGNPDGRVKLDRRLPRRRRRS